MTDDDEHTHSVLHVTGPYPFQGCVSSECDPQAHGGVVYTYLCRCGARQNVNVRGARSESGNWILPDERGALILFRNPRL